MRLYIFRLNKTGPGTFQTLLAGGWKLMSWNLDGIDFCKGGELVAGEAGNQFLGTRIPGFRVGHWGLITGTILGTVWGDICIYTLYIDHGRFSSINRSSPSNRGNEQKITLLYLFYRFTTLGKKFYYDIIGLYVSPSVAL